MRKFIAVFAACLLMISLVACGSDGEANSSQGSFSEGVASGETLTPSDDSSSVSASPSASTTSSRTRSSTGGADATTTTYDAQTPTRDDTPVDVDNTVRTIYYTVDEDNVIETSFTTEYWKMPYGREDDGSLLRDGYVLLGYSYDKGGKGELIRPGHKYTLKTADKEQVLYCVWAKETNPAHFETVVKKNGATYISAYKGSDKTVYIPRKINGKYVSGIDAKAFANNKTLTEVHISRNVTAVEAGAFSSCPNLKTVTLYDNLKTVSDESFKGSPVKTVRICAGKTPCYATSTQTFGIKYERLVSTVGQKRVILLSGSSVQYGIDTDYMQTLFKDKWTVVNFGTNGNMNVLFYLDAILPYLTKNDVVVFSPEQYGPYAYHTNGNPELPGVTLQGVSTCYNLFQNIDVSTYTAVFDGIGQYCAESAQMPSLSWEAHGKHLDKFGDLGDLTSKMNSPNFRHGANGYFRFDETVIPAEFIPNLNRVIDKAKATKATILFSYPPHNKNNIKAESLNDKAYDAYNKWTSETVHCPLISDVRNYIYPATHFDNTDYHLNAVGRKLNTEQVARDIVAAGVGVK